MKVNIAVKHMGIIPTFPGAADALTLCRVRSWSGAIDGLWKQHRTLCSIVFFRAEVHPIWRCGFAVGCNIGLAHPSWTLLERTLAKRFKGEIPDTEKGSKLCGCSCDIIAGKSIVLECEVEETSSRPHSRKKGVGQEKAVNVEDTDTFRVRFQSGKVPFCKEGLYNRRETGRQRNASNLCVWALKHLNRRVVRQEIQTASKPKRLPEEGGMGLPELSVARIVITDKNRFHCIVVLKRGCVV